MIPSIRNQQEPEELRHGRHREYFRAIGRLEAQVQALTTAVGELKTKLDGIDTRLDSSIEWPIAGKAASPSS